MKLDYYIFSYSLTFLHYNIFFHHRVYSQSSETFLPEVQFDICPFVARPRVKLAACTRRI